MATLPGVPEDLQNLPVLRKYLADLRQAISTAIDNAGGGGGGGGVTLPINESDVTNLSADLLAFLKLDGTRLMTGALDMNTHLIHNVVNPAAAQDAATKNYTDTQDASVAAAAAAAEVLDLRLNGSRVMTGALDMGTHLIDNVVDPVSAQDAATKNYVDTHDKYAVVRIVGSGVNVTDATIAAAVAALPAAGGDIYVKPGTYPIAAPIDFTTKVVRLRGAGTSVNFTTGPTTLVPGAGISLFKNGAQGCSVEDLTVEGDNASAQVFYEGSAEVRFTRINVHDVGGIIKFASSQPEVMFKDSYINVPSGPGTVNQYLWKGSAANGTLIFDNVELFITGSNATIMSGVTAGANGPEFKVVNSYVGGGGGGGSTNLWFAQLVEWDGFLIDNAQFEISGARNFITNCGFLDFSIKFKAVWNLISNSNFSQGGTGSGLAPSQVEFAAPNAGVMAESIVTGCNFYGNFASLTGITVTNTFPIEISSCLFSNHSVQAILFTGGTSPNASKGSVIGCRFTESVPVTEGGTAVVARYAANEGFANSTILGPDSTVEGVRRYDQIGGTTTGSFVTLFTHKNKKGVTGIGTIKNIGVTNAMEVKETVTDAFGVTDSVTTTVALSSDYLLDPQTNFTTARPPYVSYKVEVRHPSAATTFTIHHATEGAE